MAEALPYQVSEDAAEYLLRFKNPLEVVSDRWLDNYGVNVSVVDIEMENVIQSLLNTHDADADYEMESVSESPTMSL